MTDDSRMLDHAGYGGAGVQAVSRVAQVEGVQPPPPGRTGPHPRMVSRALRRRISVAR